MQYSVYLVAILLLFSLNSYTQSTSDEQLASHYYQAGEFDKAFLYYEKLYKSTPSDFYYSHLLNSLLQMERYEEAEKIVKKHIKSTNNNPSCQIDLGNVYEKLGNSDKAKQLYEKMVKELDGQQSNVIQFANAFISKGKSSYALECYLKGRKMGKTSYPFNIEIATIYAETGKYEEMIEEYLGLLEVSGAYQPSVQSALQRNMGFEENSKQNQILKTQLLKRIQKYPDNEIYAEMLIWMYTQQKEFDMAFIQSKGLDLRNKEDGARIYSLAKLCASNENYDVALKALQYIITSKGKDNYYYIPSKTEVLNVLNKKIIQGNYTTQELLDLQANYYATLNELGKTSETIGMVRELAKLQAYYLGIPDTAKSLLENALNIPRVKAQDIAECKLDLGDIMVITNEIWDASLLYSQVDKEFKYDELGERAKFKNAKISYYTGEFMFAKGQLDVLKGSTSKLIANDAMYLSLLITDNTGVDTTEIPLKMFASAELLSIQNKDSLALVTVDSIVKLFPNHSLDDDILYLKHTIFIKEKNYEKAAQYLQKIIDRYSYDLLADNAIFALAEINHYRFKNLEKAKELYEKLLFDFPGSLFVVEARKRFRQLRGDKVN